MKKGKERRQILRTMTQNQIEILGSELWMKKHRISLVIVAVVCFAWMGLITINTEDSIVASVIALIPFLVSFILWTWKYLKEGKRFWENIKDKEQPIDLG